MRSITEILAEELSQKLEYVENVVSLMDEGNTIPFIARYRKEQHGAMDDTTLRNLAERLQYLRNLQTRREEVKRSIENQGKLTDELSAAIDEAATMTEVEDLYRPYQQKRRTRATMAREKGLAPLAETIFDQARDMAPLEELAAAYIDPEKGVNSVEEALAGASDIIAEQISDDAGIRKQLRPLLRRSSQLRSRATTEDDSVYRLYYDFNQPLNKLAGHQILALNRGEREGVLKLGVDQPEEQAKISIRKQAVMPGSPAMAFVRAACDDAYDRLIAPSMERELRNELTDAATEQAIATLR